MKNIKTAISFRIYPASTTSLYFKVIIHPTRKLMKAEIIKQAKVFKSSKLQAVVKRNRFHAITHGFKLEYVKSKRPLPILGEIHFYATYIPPEIISHEMVHAGMNWARRLQLDVWKDEERLAYAVGAMTQQFYDKATRAGKKVLNA
jgi:hypothetical protein